MLPLLTLLSRRNLALVDLHRFRSDYALALLHKAQLLLTGSNEKRINHLDRTLHSVVHGPAAC